MWERRTFSVYFKVESVLKNIEIGRPSNKHNLTPVSFHFFSDYILYLLAGDHL